MRRRTILGVAACLALLAAVLPLGIMTLVSRQRAMAAEQAHLMDYAGWTLLRTSQTLERAKAALRTLEDEHALSCTPAHILRMRQLTLQNRAVEEMGFFPEGRRGCTSWGLASGGPPKTGGRDLPGGYRLTVGVRPKFSPSERMLLLMRGDHGALINPKQLVEVLVDSEMTLGVATHDGHLIAASGPIDPALLARLISTPGEGGALGRHVFASRTKDGLTAFALADRSIVQGRVDRELLIFVPLAILISAALIAVVVLVARRRLSPEVALKEAIRERAIVAYYQPIIELSTGRCVGAEALARWRQADGAWAAPDAFVTLAERSGVIDDLTDLMIERVVADLDAMLGGEREVHVSINLSASDMATGRFLPVLERALAVTKVAPSQIWLEATERGFINAEAARAVLDQARTKGHMVAIDDFGTGYSSLSLLESLPLDALKIDKSFIAALGSDAATSVVTPHIIEMAHGLNLDVIAEGVETAEQAAIIAAAGVQFAQGWLYSEALPPEAFAAFFYARNLPDLAAAPPR